MLDAEHQPQVQTLDMVHKEGIADEEDEMVEGTILRSHSPVCRDPRHKENCKDLSESMVRTVFV